MNRQNCMSVKSEASQELTASTEEFVGTAMEVDYITVEYCKQRVEIWPVSQGMSQSVEPR